MRTRWIPLALAAVLVAACSDTAAAPTGETTAATAATTQDMGPGMLARLRAEGDAETQALLDRAMTARQKMREAFRAGDEEAARIAHLEARGYMHTAILKTFPEMAATLEARERACQMESAPLGASRMGMMGRGGQQAGMGRAGAGMNRWQQLRAEADEETAALLDQAAEAREQAREAFRAGDTVRARTLAQEARQATHQAMTRVDPDAAALMGRGQGNGMCKGRRGMGR